MTTKIDNRTQQAILNDQFRKSGFGVTLTCGVQGVEDLDGLMVAVRSFSEFTEDNDPYKEHDFGRIEWKVIRSSGRLIITMRLLMRGKIR